MGGGREGPAAQAAIRAAEMGITALKGASLERLGGLAAQVEALEKLVLLPIRVSPSCAVPVTSFLAGKALTHKTYNL